MLTVKQIMPNSEEFIFETTEVNFVPPNAKENKAPVASLWRYDISGRAYKLSSGVAYVVNDEGRTVAKYDLGGWYGPESETD